MFETYFEKTVAEEYILMQFCEISFVQFLHLKHCNFLLFAPSKHIIR